MTGWRGSGRGAGTAAAVCAALLASGCGPDAQGKAGEPEPSRLLTALAHAAPEGEERRSISFVDAVALRKLSKTEPERFGFTDPLGGPTLRNGLRGAEEHGIDPGDVELSLVLGRGTGLLLGSFDEKEITARTEADGYERREQDGRTLLVAPEEQRPDMVLQVSGDKLAYASEAGDLAQVGAAREDSLAEDPDHRWLSDCLGEVYRVDITRQKKKTAVPLVAVGQGATSPEKTFGVVCAPTGDERAAERAARALEEAVAEDADDYRGAEVSVVRGERPGVKVTVPDRPEHRRAGRLLFADLELLFALASL